MSRQNEKIHCIYCLIDNEGIVRYIGEGTENRSKSLSGRSKEYKDIYLNGDILILYDKLTKKESRELEFKILKKYRTEGISGFNLLNKTMYNTLINDLSYNVASKYFEISTDSPSGLKWIYHKYDKLIGKSAGSLEPTGYFRVQLFGIKYVVHRIVWVLHNKQDLDPAYVVDHFDSNPSNNKVENLFKITQKENSFKAVRNKTKLYNCNVTGISKTKQLNSKLYRYRVTVVSPEGKILQKSFSIKKYGEDLALSLAKEWRDKYVSEFYKFKKEK